MPLKNLVDSSRIRAMSQSTKETLFRAALGRHLRGLRERADRRVEDLAFSARRWGLPWRRSVVTQIEQGRRRLWLEEWLILPGMYSEALGQPLDWEDLLPQEGTVALTRGVTCYALALGQLVQMRGMMDDRIRELFTWPAIARVRQFAAVEALGRRLWGSEGVPLPILQAARHAEHGEAEVKVARLLGVSPLELCVAAFRLWNRSLTKERDAQVTRAGEKATASLSSLRALRGHATRQLLAQLRPILIKMGTKPRQLGRPHSRPGRKLKGGRSRP